MARFDRVTPRLPVADLSRTIAFYTRTFGFSEGVLWPDDRPIFCILDRGQVSLAFYVPDGSRETGTPGSGGFYLEVEDVRGLYAALKDRLLVEWGPETYWYGRREFAVRDPDGYMIIFSEPTEDSPTCS